ncbi:MAG: hypothetical protein GX913_08685 [Clostridiales bacterium]|nr:hypothetical protein [Clostridiales bacterium]
MSDIYTIIKEIEKKKNLEINLSKYANNLMSLYHRNSNIGFAFNYYTYYEMVSENQGDNKTEIFEFTKSLNEIISSYLNRSLRGDELESAINKLNKIRDSIINSMKDLTTYVDIFQIYEYALNRIEYGFSDKESQEEFKEEDIVMEILQYIATDKDAVIVNRKMKDILGQLPVRMTKQKYYQIISDSFSLYKDATKSTIEGLLYMLRTCTMLERPKCIDDSYKELASIVKEFESTDFNFISKGQYESLHEKLTFGIEFITNTSDMYLMLAELINNSMVILLSLPYAITDTSESENYFGIIEFVNKQMNNTSDKEIPEQEVYKMFESLEGNQERIFDQIQKIDYLLDSVELDPELLKSLMMDKIYNSLKLISKLISTSTFVELNDTGEEMNIISEKELTQIRDGFIEELMEHLKKYPKLIKRGIMAATLTLMPIIFNNLEEFKDYIENSLSMCSDPFEKRASIKLITELIEDDKDWNKDN